MVGVLTVQPWPLDDEARAALQPALDYGKLEWAQVEGWLADAVACIWRMDGMFCLTFANANDEIEVVLAGGEKVRDCIGPWEAAMRALPQHKGKTLILQGRKGWKRLLPHWEAQDLPTGRVIMKVTV